MKKKINIVGRSNWYDKMDCWCRGLEYPKDFDAVFNNKKNNEITYFITDGAFEVDEIESKIKVALPTECRPYDGNKIYDFIEKNYYKFDFIATYDDRLIKLFPEKTCPIPEGGTWIWPQNFHKIHKKTKLCSYISSLKSSTPEQKLRVKLINFLYQNKNEYDIDLYGRGHNPYPEDHGVDYDGKASILKDYAFSITIENWQQDHYFSEKLMDCLMVGTIPIYKGARKIQNYFNPEGLIIAETTEDILEATKTLSFDMYEQKIEAVKENFKKSKKFIDSVSYHYNKYIK
tara:strand:+ start:2850 stop:3713 length:864 start_codon:yes stop_codon:yes gene_type:complete